MSFLSLLEFLVKIMWLPLEFNQKFPPPWKFHAKLTQNSFPLQFPGKIIFLHLEFNPNCHPLEFSGKILSPPLEFNPRCLPPLEYPRFWTTIILFGVPLEFPWLFKASTPGISKVLNTACMNIKCKKPFANLIIRRLLLRYFSQDYLPMICAVLK